MAESELVNDPNLSDGQLAGLARDILAAGRSIHFRVRGGSMRPFIQDGDLLEIKPVKTSDIRRGDILLYHFDRKQLLVHRVVRIYRTAGDGEASLATSFILQGDALLSPDGCIAADDIIGRVETVDRADRSWTLNSTYQKMLAAILVIGLSGGKWFYRKAAR